MLRTRTTFIVLLLLVSLATAGLLAWQAHYAFASHRQSAESVLRDYASLVADEVIRRASAEVGYSGYYTLVSALVRQGGQPGGLAASGDERVRRAASLARSFFKMDRANGRVSFSGQAPPGEVVEWLARRLNQASVPGRAAAYRTLHTVVGGAPRTFVVASPEASACGFEVDLPSLAKWFETALGRESLIPSSLGHGQVTNASLHVRVRDHGGVERFRLGERHWPGLGIEKPFGDVYNGLFAGSIVEASIDPEASRQLVIGGLPRSRLPILLGLLTITAGLMLTAILQLRRELALHRLQAEFVSSVSHELRTPLTQIRMFAETLLLDRVRSPEERKRSLEIIDREARRLNHLVENVLRFSRGERGGDRSSVEERELGPLIREVLDAFQPLVAGSEVGLTTRLAEGVRAAVDPDAIRQVVLNLLDNAVKYGPKDQRVVVGLEAANGLARIYVDDEGPGVPPGEQKRVFERFHRLPRDRRSAVAGTGIGLSVVRDLVSRHGGRCFIERGERGGARFVVELPAT